VLYVGVTGDALLSGKAHRHLVQSFAAREAAARAFVAALRPDLPVEMSELSSAPPKAATLEPMACLVISRETAAGGRALQAQRAAAGFAPLVLLVVDLVGATSQAPLARKLSSSGLRELEAAQEAREAGRLQRAASGGAAGGAASGATDGAAGGANGAAAATPSGMAVMHESPRCAQPPAGAAAGAMTQLPPLPPLIVPPAAQPSACRGAG
jgi:phosphopantetheine adenylyltransferase